MADKRPCPCCVSGEQKPGKLMCLRCWKATPAELQKAVYAAWRTLSGDRRDLEKVLAYRKAADAAVAAARRAVFGDQAALPGLEQGG